MFRNTLSLLVLIALSLSSSHLFAAVQKTIGTSDTSGELTLQEILNNNGYTINGNPIDVTADQAGYKTFSSTQTTPKYYGAQLIDSYYTQPISVIYVRDSNKYNFYYETMFDTSVDSNGDTFNFSLPGVGTYYGETYLWFQFVFDDDGNLYSGLDDNSYDYLTFNTDQGYIIAGDFGYASTSAGAPRDSDFNDMVFQLNVPEPTSACLLLGCCAMLVARPRKRQRIG